MQYFDNFKMAAMIDGYEFAVTFKYNVARNYYSYTRKWCPLDYLKKKQDGLHSKSQILHDKYSLLQYCTIYGSSGQTVLAGFTAVNSLEKKSRWLPLKIMKLA